MCAFALNLTDQPGDTVSDQVTIKEIADKTGFSLMTVSRALNNKPYVKKKTKEEIFAVAEKLGYTANHIAKSLVSNKTNIIGVVVPEISHSFFPEVIKGIEEVIHEANYQLLFAQSDEDCLREKSAVQTFISQRVDGILISMSETTKDFELFHTIKNRGIPLVFFDRCVYDIGLSCVAIDNKKSAQIVTEYLISNGYRRIAHLICSNAPGVGDKRLEGYKCALKNNNILFDQELVAECGFDKVSGYKAMKNLLNLPGDRWPEAVVTVNDPTAYGAMKAIKESGMQIPEDMAIIGFSNDIISNLMTPSLTTVKQPAYEIGKKASQKLLSHISNSSDPVETIFLETELIIRDTCTGKI
ncbi:LacI family DNA-binding transcriptional regulator [candidate division KSB1 bacterium]